MSGIETLSTREVYRNAWLSVREDGIRRADGSTGIYGVVDKQDYALIIALDGDRLMLVEQFRYPLGERRWEFPQGSAAGVTDPAELAARELREETGLRAASLRAIGRLDVAPGMSSQRGHVFVATDLTQGEHDREHSEQDLRSAWCTRGHFEQRIRDGLITDAQSIAAYALLQSDERAR